MKFCHLFRSKSVSLATIFLSIGPFQTHIARSEPSTWSPAGAWKWVDRGDFVSHEKKLNFKRNGKFTYTWNYSDAGGDDSEGKVDGEYVVEGNRIYFTIAKLHASPRKKDAAGKYFWAGDKQWHNAMECAYDRISSHDNSVALAIIACNPNSGLEGVFEQ